MSSVTDVKIGKFYYSAPGIITIPIMMRKENCYFCVTIGNQIWGFGLDRKIEGNKRYKEGKKDYKRVIVSIFEKQYQGNIGL